MNGFLLLGMALLACGVFAHMLAQWVQTQAGSLGLVQLPNHRSSHVVPTPHGGGLGIVCAASVAGLCIAAGLNWQTGFYWLGLGLVLAALALKNDIQHVAAKLRFTVQALACAAVVWLLWPLPPLALPGLTLTGAWLALVLWLGGVWWMNLFNFMDGIDGLAALQAIYMLLAAVGLMALHVPNSLTEPALLWMLCIAAATLGFLMLNWAPAKIFMGDVGSIWLAFVLFALGLVCIQNQGMNYAACAVLGAVFVSDATVTLCTRLLRGQPWYEAHRSHAYQRLSRRWQGQHGDAQKVGHRNVTLVVLLVNVVWLTPLAGWCLYRPELCRVRSSAPKP